MDTTCNPTPILTLWFSPHDWTPGPRYACISKKTYRRVNMKDAIYGQDRKRSTSWLCLAPVGCELWGLYNTCLWKYLPGRQEKSRSSFSCSFFVSYTELINVCMRWNKPPQSLQSSFSHLTSVLVLVESAFVRVCVCVCATVLTVTVCVSEFILHRSCCVNTCHRVAITQL